MRQAFPAALLLSLTACASLTNVSEVTGERYSRVEMNRSAAIILDVDGRSSNDRYVRVDPGKRVIRMQSFPVSGFRQGEVREMTLDIKPCMRYYLNVQRKTGISQDWEPVIDKEEPLPGCKP